MKPLTHLNDYPRTSEDWSYVAGLFEGEGCVSSFKQNRQDSYLVVVRISQSGHIALLQWLSEVFGGSLNTFAAVPPRRTRFRWHLSGQAAIEFLHELYPYLKGPKSREVLLAFKLHNNRKDMKTASMWHRRLSEQKRK